MALAQLLEREHIGHVFASPADISWAPDVLVQPDVIVADFTEARTLGWDRIRHLLLAAEVLSHSSVRADRFAKRRLLQEVGIPVYWLVNPDSGRVEIGKPGGTLPALERAPHVDAGGHGAAVRPRVERPVQADSGNRADHTAQEARPPHTAS